MKFIKRKAFTLIEIAVVILVIGILIAGIAQAMEMFAEVSLRSARNLSKSSRLGRVDDLTIWLDATSEKAFDNEKGDASAVSIWNDTNQKSTTAISSTSSSASLYPSYTLSAINSLPAVSFKKTSASVGNCATVPSESFVNDSEDFTLYLIYNPKSLDDGIILEKNNASATTFPFSLELSSGYYKFSVKNSTETISVASPKQAIIKTPNLIRLSRVKGSQIEIVIDGVSTTQSDTLTSSTLNNPELAIGCRNGATPANFISGDFGETAFFNRNINVKEKAEIEEYLYKKWKMKKFEGTLPAICSVTGGAGYTRSILPIGSASFPCDVAGYAGTINYNCPSSGGTATITGSCTQITCNVPLTVNVSQATVVSSSAPLVTALTCKAGYFGAPTYTCTGTTSTGTYTAGGIPCARIYCYSNYMPGHRGDGTGAKKYLYTFGGPNGSALINYALIGDSKISFDIDNLTTLEKEYIPYVKKLKLFDVYHGAVSNYSSQQLSWDPHNTYASFNIIDTSNFLKSAYLSTPTSTASLTNPGITPESDGYDMYGYHTFTRYAHFFTGTGQYHFYCDEGYTGIITYYCLVDGSTLDPSSGSCIANTCTISADIGYTQQSLSGAGTFPCNAPGYSGTMGYACTINGGIATKKSYACTTEIVNTCSLAGGAGYSAKTLLPIGSASFPCDVSGFTGTINYTCPSSGGTATKTGGSCISAVNTCSLAGGDGYSAKTELTVGSASFPCDAGYAGTINYTCPSSGGTATITSESCTASPIKCYAKDKVGLRGTHYFDTFGSTGSNVVYAFTTPEDGGKISFQINELTAAQQLLFPLVNRLKLFNVYHGSLNNYTSAVASWASGTYASYDIIDVSNFPQQSDADILGIGIYVFNLPSEFEFYAYHVLTKYARILGYGINTFNCDSGFTGTLTYNCTVDGSTLDQTSGTCTAN